jgi:hypothetical protein
MTSLHVIGRGAILALAAAGMVSFAAKAEPAMDGAPRFRAIQVDVSGVRDTGAVESADVVARELPGDLRKSFAAYLTNDPRAPVLVARVNLVTLGADGGGGINSSQAIDYIEGVGVVVGPGGHAIASYPLTSSVHSYPVEDNSGGVSGYQRISNLTASFAQWLPGKMGL